jgi:hypothetical protein
MQVKFDQVKFPFLNPFKESDTFFYLLQIDKWKILISYILHKLPYQF